MLISSSSQCPTTPQHTGQYPMYQQGPLPVQFHNPNHYIQSPYNYYHHQPSPYQLNSQLPYLFIPYLFTRQTPTYNPVQTSFASPAAAACTTLEPKYDSMMSVTLSECEATSEINDDETKSENENEEEMK